MPVISTLFENNANNNWTPEQVRTHPRARTHKGYAHFKTFCRIKTPVTVDVSGVPVDLFSRRKLMFNTEDSGLDVIHGRFYVTRGASTLPEEQMMNTHYIKVAYYVIVKGWSDV